MRLVLARRDALILLGWQVCALLLTGTGYFSQRLAERNVSAPAAQSFANYLLLALIFVPTLALTRSRRRRGLRGRSRGTGCSSRSPTSRATTSSSSRTASRTCSR